MGKNYIKAWINPLAFTEVEEPWASLEGINTPDSESILRFACTPEIKFDLNSIFDRYLNISKEKVRLLMAPAEPRILEKLIWPLRHAKSSFMFGNFLGTIALCGMVAEMVTILLKEISSFKIEGRPMEKGDEEAIYGRSFENLGQYRRVEILFTYHIIGDDIKTSFDLIRSIRRKYLHLWSQDHERIIKDAIKVFQNTVQIVVFAIGQDINEGKISINPKIMTYLERSGFYEPEE